MSDRLSFRLLGPLGVARAGAPISIGGPSVGAVLALLLLRAGEPMTVDALADAIWGDIPAGQQSLEPARWTYALMRSRLGSYMGVSDTVTG